MNLGAPKREKKKFPRTDKDELLAGMGLHKFTLVKSGSTRGKEQNVPLEKIVGHRVRTGKQNSHSL